MCAWQAHSRFTLQAHFLPDDTGDESAASGPIVEEGTDANLDVDAGAGGSRQSVGVGGSDIDARDLVAVPPDKPSKSRDAGFNGKLRDSSERSRGLPESASWDRRAPRWQVRRPR